MCYSLKLEISAENFSLHPQNFVNEVGQRRFYGQKKWKSTCI